MVCVTKHYVTQGQLLGGVMKNIVIAATALLMTSSAFAADAVVDGPVPESVYNWSGAYIGLHGGYSRGSGDEDDYLGGETAHPEADGFLLGGQVGYNYQWGAFVVGIEGDLSYSSADGEGDIEGVINARIKSEYNYLASVTGRVGYAVDRTLIYAKGGIGFTELELTDVALSGVVNGSGSESLTGWTIGGGVEHAFNDHWTIKGEYQFYDFSADIPTTVLFGGRVYDDDFNVHAIKVGFNYKF
jgi:outer membrane immunogenic protein